MFKQRDSGDYREQRRSNIEPGQMLPSMRNLLDRTRKPSELGRVTQSGDIDHRLIHWIWHLHARLSEQPGRIHSWPALCLNWRSRSHSPYFSYTGHTCYSKSHTQSLCQSNMYIFNDLYFLAFKPACHAFAYRYRHKNKWRRRIKGATG